MNFSIKTITLSIFTLLIAVTAFASQAKADVYQHVDELALSIQKQSRDLLRETVHYRYTPQYRKIVGCTLELRKLAGHIHDVTHFEGNLDHLAFDLRDLDREFHELEELFDQVEANASRGCTSIVGNTAHVKRLLNSMEDSIHHLRDDVATMRRGVVRTTRVVRTPVYIPTRPVYQSSRPVYASPNSFEISWAARNYSNGQRGHGHKSGHRGNDNRGHGHGSSHRGHDNRNGGVGFSIGGGSTKINFRF